jgi:hypothetical protein
VLANVKPLPGFVKRISTADVGHGEVNGAFHIWPTARPVITIEPGERLSIALRIKALTPDAGSLKLGPIAPETWKLRREANGDYWLDIPIGPANETSTQAVPLVVELSDGRSREIRVRLVVNVPAENLVVTPKEIDFGQVTLENLRGTLKRVGVRKIAGSLHIKALTTTLAFLKLEQATMVEGSNYLIRITIDPTKPLKPGAYDGTLVIETDDGQRVEVPMKLKLIR